jgi:uncharacterized damage-inducible protein DinB
MPTEAQTLTLVIERIARDTIAVLKQLSDEQLNAPLPIPQTNTAYAIATHAVGMGEFWVLALAGGRRVQRDRQAEFHASGSGAGLIERFECWISETHAVLDGLDANALDAPAEPPREFRTTGNLGEKALSVRDCLLHVIEHDATHLGHLQITRQFLLAQDRA